MQKVRLERNYAVFAYLKSSTSEHGVLEVVGSNPAIPTKQRTNRA